MRLIPPHFLTIPAAALCPAVPPLQDLLRLRAMEVRWTATFPEGTTLDEVRTFFATSDMTKATLLDRTTGESVNAPKGVPADHSAVCRKLSASPFFFPPAFGTPHRSLWLRPRHGPLWAV